MNVNQHLQNAEQELRRALKSSSDKSAGHQLKRIADTINTVEDIQRRIEPEIKFENTKYNDGFFLGETYPRQSSYLPSGSQDFWEEDGISFTGNPGAMGNDHITLFS